MIADRYVWSIWASATLLPWLGLYLANPRHRRTMVWASVLTVPFGLTEPLFVPEYWSPPSLFDLAMRTGFDLESLIFSFGIGGVGAVLVNVLTRRSSEAVGAEVRHRRRHRLHPLAVASPIVVFTALFPMGWNPIYPGIAAMLAGAAFAVWCRPDLRRTTLLGGAVFLVYYVIFLTGIEITASGYIERVWNLRALSGLHVGFIPLEKILFAVGFGAYWAGVYEHFTWRRPVPLTNAENISRVIRDAPPPA